jgi:hypothetical protein
MAKSKLNQIIESLKDAIINKTSSDDGKALVYDHTLGAMKLGTVAGGSSATSVYAEVPSGVVDGSNTIFTIAASPKAGSERIYVNGIRMRREADYTISDVTITLVTSPPVDSNILVDYDK